MPQIDEKWSPEKKAYREWLLALRSELGQVSVSSAIHKFAKIIAREQGSEALIRRVDFKSYKDVVDQWFRRGSIPDESDFVLNESLLRVMATHVPSRPKTVEVALPFARLVEVVRRQNAGKSKTGQSIADTARALYEKDDVLVLPVSTIEEIDPQTLAMGSWYGDGSVPPYCPRDVDKEIISALNAGTNQLVVISGPPKSGKTRTLLEALAASKHRNSNVYWVSSRPSAIPKLIRALKPEHASKTVIVLDDLQGFPFDVDSGLTSGNLDELKRRGTVVATVHDTVMQRWSLGEGFLQIESGFGNHPNSAVVLALAEAQIRVSAKLKLDEIERATKLLGIDKTMEPEYVFLAAWLASTAALVKQAKLLLTGENYEIAAIQAVIDARVLKPSGAELNEIKNYAIAELAILSPNAIWSNSKWEGALDALTSPITAGAPHSILMRISTDSATWGLMDSLWSEVKPEIWAPPKQEVTQYTPVKIGYLAMQAGLVESCYNILREAAQSGDFECMHDLGCYLLDHGKLEEAEYWLVRAESAGFAETKNALGLLYERRGDLGKAEELFLASAITGLPSALNNLGELLFRRGDVDEAEKLWERSAESGYSPARFNLGALLSSRGDVAQAEKLYLLAAEDEHAVALNNLGLISERRGQFDAAEDFYTRAAELGYGLAINNLANFMFNRGQFDDAERWLHRALDAGFVKANLVRGMLHEKRGESELAEEYYMRAVDAGVDGAENYLGVFYIHEGKLELAELIFQKLAGHGDALGMNNLGSIALKRGDFETAKDFFLKASRLGFSLSLLNLGYLAEIQGATKDAEEWYSEGIATGGKFEFQAFADYLVDEGKADAAQRWIQLAQD